jgi:type IV pilus assembly protein PilY1
MITSRARTLLVATLCVGAIVKPLRTMADDIDIFLGTSGGTADAPNVIFLVDNSPNWSRAAQQWPDNNGIQGVAELAAIETELQAILTQQPPKAVNVGLALLTSYAGTTANGSTPGTGGGYIRFGIRDMTNATNNLALQHILEGIKNNINDPSEKLSGMASKDEDAGFYEIYKYLSGLPVFTGPYGSSYAAQNAKVDVAGNTDPYSAAGQGLTSGFAVSNGVYQSPLSSQQPCAGTYIIYIANNANNTGSIGQHAYQPTVADTNPALTATPGLDTWTDEWTRFLYANGVIVPSGNNNGSVVTYILDAYNAQQNVGYTHSLQNAAAMSGGAYFKVGSQSEIASAIATILAQIQAVNTTFASASLPINATSRAQNSNQVFIPMFRPDPKAKPLWMGNLKEYQLIDVGGNTSLGDASNPPMSAVNLLTGFPTPCAQSFWTSDSGTYWNNILETPAPKGTCPTTAYSPYSDAPDGPIVEKGGVAEVVRKGNNPPTTNTNPTWAVNRTVYTLAGLSGSTLTTFDTSTGLPATLVNFILGQDVNDENRNGNVSESRASLHSDSIHSRPLPVDYGGTTGVTVYYGSNDGMLRAINAATGAERWAFVPPEFYTPAPALPPATPTGFARLMYNSPVISYPSMPTGITPTPAPKDYYFDGSIGLYQTAGNSKVWIYPTMRRGGRMIYALDVTNPASPVFKWKAGCPYLNSDTGCTTQMSSIGQTWSMPIVVSNVLGYSGPVVVVGGGYDSCEDANSATPSCTSSKGAGVYVLDADTGAVIKFFNATPSGIRMTRSVAADVALIAAANAGVVDHAYAVDTGGNIWRIDFAAAASDWAINRVAYTNGAGRKFLYPPALLAAPGGQVYLALGSGDREHPLQSQYPYGYPSGGVLNRFYVYRDSLGATTATNLDDTNFMADFTQATTCSTPGILPASTMKGWFMDLDQYGTGEQTVTSAVIAAGMAAFSTNRPVPSSQGTCSTQLGEAHGYWVNLFNASGGIGVTGQSCGGTRSSTFVGFGLPPSPVLATVLVDGRMETVVIGASQLSGGVSAAIAPQEVRPTIIPKRKMVYWKSSGEN